MSEARAPSAEERAARGRACNCVKFQTSRNLLPVLKTVTHAQRHVAKHVLGVLFLVRFNNFEWTTGFYCSYVLFL